MKANISSYKEEITMSESEAKKLLSMLTYEEKVKLNEMLKALEQKRQLSQLPPVSTE